MDHPAVLDRHAQIFFSQDQYWIKDLTGQMLISINGQPVGGQPVGGQPVGQPVHFQSPLTPEDLVALTPQGPTFRFLDGGRLAEIEKSDSEERINASHEKEETRPPDKHREGCIKRAKSIINKLF